MAIMDRPEDMNPAEDNVLQLEENGNIEEQNLEYSGLVAWVNGRFEASKTWRQPDEERWLKAYRNYRGIYGPEVQFTETEKSQAFIKITKTKVLAAYAQVVDVLFAGGKFPIGVESPGNAVGVSDAAYFDPQEVTEEKINEKLGEMGTSLLAKFPLQPPVLSLPLVCTKVNWNALLIRLNRA